MDVQVEYGIGVTNRFAFLEEDLENENESVSPATAVERRKCAEQPQKVKIKESTTTTGGAVGRSAKSGASTAASKTKIQNVESVDNEKASSRNLYDNRKRTGGRDLQNAGKRDGHPKGLNAPRRSRDPEKSLPEIEEINEQQLVEGEVNDKDDDKGDKEIVVNENNDGSKANDETTDAVPEKTFTLTEWKAMQAPREKPIFNTRRPGEGEDLSRFGKLILKKKEEVVEDEVEFEIDEAYYPQRAGKFKQISDVGFTTGYQKRRGGRFSGTRDRVTGGGDGRDTSSEENIINDKFRGGRSKFGSRGGARHIAAVPRIDDATDFPSLGN